MFISILYSQRWVFLKNWFLYSLIQIESAFVGQVRPGFSYTWHPTSLWRTKFFFRIYPQPHPNTLSNYLGCFDFDSGKYDDKTSLSYHCRFTFLELSNTSSFPHHFNASKYFALNLQKKIRKCELKRIKMKTKSM